VPANRIVTVATPDYTVSPAGSDYGDPRQQHDAIVAANATMSRLAAERGIAYVDIFDLSLRAAADPSLVADDGLHPSGAQYALWVERIVPVVEGLIGRPSSSRRGRPDVNARCRGDPADPPADGRTGRSHRDPAGGRGWRRRRARRGEAR
jgi:hypothetical protein